MRRILRKVAEGQTDSLGDTTTLAEPQVVDEILKLEQSEAARAR
jgi:acetyl-CoA synthetase